MGFKSSIGIIANSSKQPQRSTVQIQSPMNRSTLDLWTISAASGPMVSCEIIFKYDGRFQSNVSYFIVLVYEPQRQIVGAMTVEGELLITCNFFFLATESSWAAVWQNDVWHKNAHETNVYHWISLCGKTAPLTFIFVCSVVTEIKLQMWQHFGGGNCVLPVTIAMCLTNHVPGSFSQLWNYENEGYWSPSTNKETINSDNKNT